MQLLILSFMMGIGVQELFLLLIFLALPALLWLWAIVDLLGSKFQSDTNKLIWALVIIFVPFIGSILYLVVGRKQKITQP
jgi:hypothetical protein